MLNWWNHQRSVKPTSVNHRRPLAKVLTILEVHAYSRAAARLTQNTANTQFPPRGIAANVRRMLENQNIPTRNIQDFFHKREISSSQIGSSLNS